MRKSLVLAALIIFFSVVILTFAGFFKSSYEPANPNQANQDESPTVLSQKQSLAAEDQNQTAPKIENSQEVVITRVIDGDTVELEGGVKVRYIGIDTPETSDPRTGVQCFGKEATKRNKKLVEGKKVFLEKDVSETDKYGRTLRYVWVSDRLVNEILVKEGYAFSSPYPPDVKYQNRLNRAEVQARNSSIGMWGSCKFVTGEKTTLPTGDCVIKGNISSSGEKIYHLPGQKYYNRTVISESKGERWFCSEAEAQKSGWRRSKL